MKRFVYMRVDTTQPHLEDVVYGAILASRVKTKISASFESCTLEKSEMDNVYVLAMKENDKKFLIKRIKSLEELADDGSIYLLAFNNLWDYAVARQKLMHFEHTSILIEQHKTAHNKAHVALPEKSSETGRRYPVSDWPDESDNVPESRENSMQDKKKKIRELGSNVFTVLFLGFIAIAIICMMYFCDLYNKRMKPEDVQKSKIVDELPALEQSNCEDSFLAKFDFPMLL